MVDHVQYSDDGYLEFTIHFRHVSPGQFIFRVASFETMYDDDEFNYDAFDSFDIKLQGDFTQDKKNVFAKYIKMWTAEHLETVAYAFDHDKNNMKQLYRFREQQKLYGDSSEWTAFENNTLHLFDYLYNVDTVYEESVDDDWPAYEPIDFTAYVQDNYEEPQKVYSAYLQMCFGIYNALKSKVAGGQGFQPSLHWAEPDLQYRTHSNDFFTSSYNGVDYIGAHRIKDVHLKGVLVSQQYNRGNCELLIMINGQQFNLLYEPNTYASPYRIRDEENIKYRIYFYGFGTYCIEYDHVDYQVQKLSCKITFKSANNKALLTISLPMHNECVNIFEARSVEVPGAAQNVDDRASKRPRPGFASTAPTDTLVRLRL